MNETKQSLTQKLKDSLAALREGLLSLIFILLLVAPSWVSDRLKNAGFTEGSLAGFKWEVEKSKQETQNAGMTILDLQQKLEQISKELVQLKNTDASPANNQKIDSLVQQIDQSTESVKKVDQKLKTSLLAQESIIQSIKETPVASEGWIFLGRVNGAKNKWSFGAPQTIKPVDPPKLQDAVLTITDNVYLRADTRDNYKTAAPVISVIQENEQVKVKDIYYSAAKGGGYFVWVKIERLRN